MDIRSPERRDIGRYVKARRELASISSFPQFPRRRRHIDHLTQGELAELIGVSTVVISQVEQGRYPNINANLMRKVGDVLGFSHRQLAYVLGLLELRPDAQIEREPVPEWVTKHINQIGHPVAVLNPRYDIVAINPTCASLLVGTFPEPFDQANAAEAIFLEPATRTFFVNWKEFAKSIVSGLKVSIAFYPQYRDSIEALALDLEIEDEEFDELWWQDDPLFPPTIEKKLNHPVYGELNVYQVLTDIVEVPTLTRIEFLPADEATRAKLLEMSQGFTHEVASD